MGDLVEDSGVVRLDVASYLRLGGPFHVLAGITHAVEPRVRVQVPGIPRPAAGVEVTGTGKGKSRVGRRDTVSQNFPLDGVDYRDVHHIHIDAAHDPAGIEMSANFCSVKIATLLDVRWSAC